MDSLFLNVFHTPDVSKLVPPPFLHVCDWIVHVHILTFLVLHKHLDYTLLPCFISPINTSSLRQLDEIYELI